MQRLIKRLLVSFTLLLTISSSQAQFMHGFGGTINYQFMQDEDKNSEFILMSNLTYSPRLVFGANERSSFSLGLPISAGIGLVNDGYGGIYYGGELPLVFDVNMGRKSSPVNEDSFGWYTGAGFSYRFTWLSDGEEAERFHSYGPVFRLGMRVGNNRNNPDKAMSIGLSVKVGLEEEKWKTFGLSFIQEF